MTINLGNYNTYTYKILYLNIMHFIRVYTWDDESPTVFISMWRVLYYTLILTCYRPKLVCQFPSPPWSDALDSCLWYILLLLLLWYAHILSYIIAYRYTSYSTVRPYTYIVFILYYVCKTTMTSDDIMTL